MSPKWVYAHQRRLGVIKLGDGPKARLRFDPRAVEELRQADAEPDPTAAPPERAAQGEEKPPAPRLEATARCGPRGSSGVGFPLMPTRGHGSRIQPEPAAAARRQEGVASAVARRPGASRRGRARTATSASACGSSIRTGSGDTSGAASRARDGRTAARRSSSRTSSGSSRPGHTSRHRTPYRPRIATRRFGAFARTFLAEHAVETAPNTRDLNENLLEHHLAPYFERIRLSQITWSAVDNYKKQRLMLMQRIRAARASGRPLRDWNDRPMRLSERTINMSIGLLAMILDEAVRGPDIDLAANPARDKKLRVKVPKKTVRDWLEPDEVITLLEAAEQRRQSGQARDRAQGTRGPPPAGRGRPDRQADRRAARHEPGRRLLALHPAPAADRVPPPGDHRDADRQRHPQQRAVPASLAGPRLPAVQDPHPGVEDQPRRPRDRHDPMAARAAPHLQGEPRRALGPRTRCSPPATRRSATRTT